MKIEWNMQGFNDVLHSPEVVSWVDDTAEKVTSEANKTVPDDGYSYSTKHGAQRYRAHIYPKSDYSYFSNLKHDTLLSIAMRNHMNIPGE